MKKNRKYLTKNNIIYVSLVLVALIALIPDNFLVILWRQKIVWDINHKQDVDSSPICNNVVYHLDNLEPEAIYEYLVKTKNMRHAAIVIAKCVILEKWAMLPFLKKIANHNEKSKNDKYFYAKTAIVAMNNDIRLPRVDMNTLHPYDAAMKTYINFTIKVKKEWIAYGKKHLDAIALKTISNFSIHHKIGSHSVGFYSSYYFGDYVEYSSPVNGSGKGHILSMEVDESGAVSYMVKCKLKNGKSEICGGIFPEDIKVYQPREAKK